MEGVGGLARNRAALVAWSSSAPTAGLAPGKVRQEQPGGSRAAEDHTAGTLRSDAGQHLLGEVGVRALARAEVVRPAR